MTADHALIDLERAEVEFVMPANWAEIVHQRLYVMGGGVDTFYVDDFSHELNIWVVVSVMIPWSAADQPLDLKLWLRDANGKLVQMGWRDCIWMSRTADMADGQSFRHLNAYLIPWVFPGPGSYQVMATVDDGRPKYVVFQARRAEDDPRRVGVQLPSQTE